jgi:ribonucleoside-diphosphate reductase alpha chain
MHFLDNVLSDFIKKAPKEMERARYSALRERSIGLGVMGFHSFLQANGLPIESVVAKSWNKRIFKHIKERCDVASIELANERGACEDGKEAGINERFTNKTAIAPTASISNICGESSPGIEPYSANAFTQKTLSGSFSVKNKNLQKLLASKGYDTDEVWGSIIVNAGSVAHLDCLTQDEKDVFKTALEINQMWLIEHAADRTPFICQSQSLNLFLRSNIHKKELHDLHFQAWKKGVKSLYYCRSASLQRPETVSKEHLKIEVAENTTPVLKEVDECLSCQ